MTPNQETDARMTVALIRDVYWQDDGEERLRSHLQQARAGGAACQQALRCCARDAAGCRCFFRAYQRCKVLKANNCLSAFDIRSLKYTRRPLWLPRALLSHISF